MKTSIKKNLLTCILISGMLLIQDTSTTLAASVRETDVQTASQGNELIGVTGSYENVGKNKILKRINAIRKEACEKGYINPSTGKKLTSNDYVAIKWSSALEWIAQLRAAEATVNEDHTRPNGQRCFSIKYQGEQSWAENLAWNNNGLMNGIEQWYGEKNDWVKQNANAVTGHYESLINPTYQHIGLGSFRRATGGWYGISAEFSSQRNMEEPKSSVNGKERQKIEDQAKHRGNAKIRAPAK